MHLFKKHHIPVILAAVLFLLLAVQIHAESFRYPYIGAVLERKDGAGEPWVVAKVDPAGKAAEWGMRPGDTVLKLDGLPTSRLYAEGHSRSLVRVAELTFSGEGGTVLTMKVVPDSGDLLKNLFSIVLEISLLAIGLAAYAKNPQSRLVRKFTAIHFVMAGAILTLYSTEMTLSDFVLSLCAVWLPYLLFSFCVSFVIRPTSARFSGLLLAFRSFCLLFSGLAVVAVAGEEIPGWVRETAHSVFLIALAMIALAIGLHWKNIDRTGRNLALVLVTGLYLSMLPYIFLYALPDLMTGEYILSPDYALTGLLPLSVTLLYVLGKRSVIDMKLYISRVLVHSLYFCLVFLLFYIGNRLSQPFWTPVLFGGFAALTLGYRKAAKISERGAVRRKEWLERQKLQLSIQLAEIRNIRDILNMIGEMIQSFMDVTGVCLIWHDGVMLTVHGTGNYKTTGSMEEGKWLDREFLEEHFDFVYVESLRIGNEEAAGFLCVGPKRNSSLFAEEERAMIDSVRNEAFRLLTNAGQLAELQREFRVMKEKSASVERHVSDMRKEQRILLEAQQAERIRTTYFLHDQLLQNLIFLSRDLEDLAGRGRLDIKRVETWLNCIYDSQRDIRLLCEELHPHIADKAGLEESLNWLMRSCKDKGVTAELSYEWGLEEEPDRMLRTSLFRMIRELVNNALKHSGADRILVRIWSNPGAPVVCSVSDNGAGFDPQAFYRGSRASEGKHIGLISVGNQVACLGGHMEIQSAPGEGTVITLKLLEEGSGKR